ncbi:hypothetical protein AC1031_006259 [Aphanomyces cochlioides]|nr:hypothetical protein AC1031_006259 [Aphanomyces cochlioides]
MTSTTSSKRTCPFNDGNVILKKLKTFARSKASSKRSCPFDEGKSILKKPKTIECFPTSSKLECSLDDNNTTHKYDKTSAQSEPKHVRFTTQTTFLFEVDLGQCTIPRQGASLGMKLKHFDMQQENVAEDPTQSTRNLYVEDVERRRRIQATGVTHEDIFAAHYESTKIYEGRADTDGEVEDEDLEAHQVRKNRKLGRPEDYHPPERTPHRIDEANRMWDEILLTQGLRSNPPQHQERQQEQQERQQHEQLPTQILHGQPCTITHEERVLAGVGCTSRPPKQVQFSKAATYLFPLTLGGSALPSDSQAPLGMTAKHCAKYVVDISDRQRRLDMTKDEVCRWSVEFDHIPYTDRMELLKAAKVDEQDIATYGAEVCGYRKSRQEAREDVRAANALWILANQNPQH